MSAYRVRLLPFGKAAPAERLIDLTSESDGVFQCHAMLAEYRSVELWDGNRLVCQMSQPKTTQSRPK